MIFLLYYLLLSILLNHFQEISKVNSVIHRARALKEFGEVVMTKELEEVNLYFHFVPIGFCVMPYCM